MEAYDKNARESQQGESEEIQIKPKFPHLYLIITGSSP